LARTNGPKQKKARIDQHTVAAVLRHSCPVNQLLKAFANEQAGSHDDSTVSTNRQRNLVAKQVHARGATATPYGTSVESMDVQLRDNTGVCTVMHINPFALLHFLADTFDHIGDFVFEYLSAGARIVMFIDGVSPSDGLRFAHNRDCYAVYFTFLEFPAWFISRHEVGWIQFAEIPEQLVKDGLITVSSLAKSVLCRFFSPEPLAWNFETVGVRIRTRFGSFVLKATFSCWLADFKAVKEIGSLTGASGSKPCPFCKNVIGR